MKDKGRSAVGRQIHLPLGRAFMISVQSIKIRFWRSMITAAGIFLGIAFLASVLAQNLMQWPVPEKDIGIGLVRLDGEFNTPGDYDVWKTTTVAQALSFGIPQAAIDGVADGDELNIRELALQVDRLERADRAIVRAKEKSDMLRALPAALLQGKDDKTIKVQHLKDARLPSPLIKELTNNADISLKDLKAAVQRVYNSEKRIEATRQSLAACRFDKAALQKLQDENAYTFAEILEQAKGAALTADTEGLKLVNTGGRAIQLNLDKDEAGAAASYLQSGDLIWMPDASAKSRRLWLVIMSLLVCTIGITNSMLMSVTERFKEIGTMKCLGALDKFVVELFLIESGLLGLMASFAGWVVGLGTIALIAAMTKGWVILTQVGMMDVVRLLGISLGIGMLLTVLATIAPAVRAAQMPPAAALRVEI